MSRGRAAALGLALALASARGVEAAAPVVTSVEPPSWWTGSTVDPVRLLIRGKGLGGSRVEGADGVTVGGSTASASGTALFVDVHIAGDAAPGVRRLRVVSGTGTGTFTFTVLPRLERAGRFQGFSSGDAIYLVMPDRFSDGDRGNDDPPRSRGLLDRSKPRYYHGGDLQGIIDHLPYLADLGVTALWINPIYDNADHLNQRQKDEHGQPITDYHGYGAVDLYAVEERLGDVATLRALVDAAHRAGIKVIQDQVANHVGPEHPWVDDPPTPTWLNGTRERHLANRWQTWTLMDPHAAPALRRETLDGWFVDVLPDLNQDDPEAARYLIQNSLWWMGVTGLDGIRQDTLPYVPRAYWRNWTAALKREFPRATVVGELFDGDPALVSFFQGGAVRDGVDTGVDTLFDFPLYFTLRRVFTGRAPLRDLAAVLAHDHLYPRPGALVTFLGLHDVARFASEPGASPDALRNAFTFLLTTRGTPLVYYGDEIGLPGGEDPDNRRDFPGGFPGDARDAFTAAGRTPEEQAVFARVRALLHLRREQKALRTGALQELLADETAYVYARTEGASAVVVAFNAAAEPRAVDVPAHGMRDGALIDALGTAPAGRVADGRVQLTLPARAAAVHVLRP